jgi:uncharacterized protein (DUF983 family)
MSAQSNSRIRMLARGATKRCPRCGAANLFRHWFTMADHCPGCGLKFEREQGYWTGAIAINTIIVGAAFVLVLVVAMILTLPDLPWVALLMVVIPLMTIGPLIVYPFSKTLWLAIDLGFLQPLGIKWDEGRSSA